MVIQHRRHIIDFGEGASWWEYHIFPPNGVEVRKGFWSRKTTDRERLLLWLKKQIDEAYDPPLSPTNPKSEGHRLAQHQAKKKPTQAQEEVVVEFF